MIELSEAPLLRKVVTAVHDLLIVGEILTEAIDPIDQAMVLATLGLVRAEVRILLQDQVLLKKVHQRDRVADLAAENLADVLREEVEEKNNNSRSTY